MSEPTGDAFEQHTSRFIVGIDLGTTNSAVAYVDTHSLSEKGSDPLRRDRKDNEIDSPPKGQTPFRKSSQSKRPKVTSFLIEQWVDFGTREARLLLPSFHYQPTAPELASFAQASTDEQPVAATIVVGALARDRGLQLPGRQISSAKSWLCHDGVNRRAPILPWQGDAEVEKLSPVEASSRYLAHIRKCWDQAHPAEPLAEQDVVLTLPASFDQVARQLTIEAAALAGLPRVLLIEEPQAAFYAWLNLHHDGWERIVSAGQTILVCDIGGGTTDFTLIRVCAAQDQANTNATKTLLDRDERRLTLHRVAVGQHLILGGDNLDLALAKFAENKLADGRQLAPRVWDALRQACRVAKETLLAESAPPTYSIHLPGSGSRLVGGGSQVEITTAEVQSVILEGFFPACALTERPLTQKTGFQEFGLPFANDPAITKHLAAFLWDHRRDGRSDSELENAPELELARPDWILFNGGVLESTQIKQRLIAAVTNWFAAVPAISPAWQVGVLAGDRLDVAVSRGAAYFGQVRRGTGVSIEAKLARSYYVTVSQSPLRGVCVIPGSASPGDKFRLDAMPFELNVGQPVQFPILYSSTRLADRVSECYDIDAENFSNLPPIRTVLELPGKRRQERLPVVLEAELSQIGTLLLWCVAIPDQAGSQARSPVGGPVGGQRWKLEFDVRASTETDRQAHESLAAQSGIVDNSVQAVARDTLEQCFGSNASLKPSQLMTSLAERLAKSRQAWPPSLLRSMWQDLMDFESGRLQSAEHETRWLNLLGYVLRPGYGLAADDWRVAQTWRTVYGRLAFSTPNSRSESLILWRRLAGGFTAGQQLAVYQQIAGPLRSLLDPVRRAKGGSSVAPHELAELLRLVGSLELLPTSEKSQLGRWLLELQQVKKWSFSSSAIFWTLGRLGSRLPTYGPLNVVVETDEVEWWLEEILARPPNDHAATYHLALLQCARLVNDRYRDITADVRQRVVARLSQTAAPRHYVTLVQSGGQLASEEATQILGEALPLGLTI